MTVGIAAKCKTTTLGDTLICVADTEFSHGFTSSGRHFKFQVLGGKWLAMLSADDLQHAEDLLDEINGLLAGSPNSRDSARGIQDILGTARDAVRERIGAQSLPPGLSLDDFFAHGKNTLPDWAYTEIWNALKRTRLRCELLVVGVGMGHFVHLLSVGDDTPRSHDRESFYAIGSGSLIASAILSACDPSEEDDWRLTAYRVYSAKKSSERAEGVGEETEMMYIGSGGIWIVSHEALQPLYNIYGPLPVPVQLPALVAALGALDLKDKGPSIDWQAPNQTSPGGAPPKQIEGLSKSPEMQAKRARGTSE